MKTDTKIYIISTIISLVFLVAIVGIFGGSSKETISYRDPFYDKFDNGYKDKSIDNLVKESCKKMNSILGLNLDYTKIEVRVSKELGNDNKNFQYARALSNKIIVNENLLKYKKLYSLAQVINHELIHIYVENFYPEEHSSMKNQNHVGKFQEIESILMNNGIPLASSYNKAHRNLK